MVDLFVVADLNTKDNILYAIFCIVDSPLIIGDVMRSIKSIKEDYFSILNNKNITELSSPTPRTDGLETPSASSGFNSSRNVQVWDEIVRGKLAEDTRKLNIVSIVGMGGSGKTTLATKVFNDGFVGYHFNIRGWVTVSQTYEKTDLLSQILASIGVEIDPDKTHDYSHLRGKLHKSLMDQRYLFVIDDIWNNEAWDVLKVVFPDNNTGTRVLNHLPSHLRSCFLYLGGFPEDYKFQVTRLIWLWIAEGFIQESENQSLEETAKDYLMELVDRNLVLVQGRKFDGAIKTFFVHHVLRELRSEIATKERFSVKVIGWGNRIIAPYKTSRLLIQFLPSYPPWSFDRYIHLKCSRSWRLLTVLDLKRGPKYYFPEVISLLVNLRYLAIQNEDRDFQSAICHLRSLTTLTVERSIYYPLVLPDTISNLVNLRHLHCQQTLKFPPLEMPLMNLQTISNVGMGHEPTNWVDYFPGVKKLSCSLHRERKYDLRSLTFLEILKIRCASSLRSKKKNMIRFPASLKKLTVRGCFLPWSIQSLPNLEVLKLLTHAFVGPQWDTGQQLIYGKPLPSTSHVSND